MSIVSPPQDTIMGMFPPPQDAKMGIFSSTYVWTCVSHVSLIRYIYSGTRMDSCH